MFEVALSIGRRSRRGFAAVTLFAVIFASACTTAVSPDPTTLAPSPTASAPAAPAAIGTFELNTDWQDNGFIPIKNTCEGDRTSPAVTWRGAPEGTVEFVLIMEVLGTGNVSWVAVGIPGGSSGSLPEAIRGGTTGSIRTSYQAPCPSPGQQQEYILTLYALSSHLPAGVLSHTSLEVLPTTLRDAMSGRELAEATVAGWYTASIDCEVCGGTVFP